MKNSPHKYKHQVKKALRKASRISLHPREDRLTEKTGKAVSKYNQHREENNYLKPLNIKTIKEIFHFYIQHLERNRLIDKSHSKRSTPGMIEEDTPYTQPNYHSPKTFTLRTHQGFLKTDKIGRKILKGKNSPYKEAA